MNNQTINAINKRDIDNSLFSINIISHQITFNDGNDYLYTRTINILIGTNIDGVRKYITSVFDDEYEKVSDWYNLFLKLKSKGLNNVFFIITNKKIIFDALKLAFKEANMFYSVLNNFYKFSKYVSLSYSDNVLSDIKDVCLSTTIDEFNINKYKLYDANSNLQFLIDLLEKEFIEYNKSFEYPYIIRKHLLSYYFIKEFKHKLRLINISKSSFTSINEFIEPLLPTIQTFETRKYCPKSEWNQIISYLYSNYKELILCTL